MASSAQDRFPTAEQTLAHPAYPTTIWNLTPSRSGKAAAAIGRGGPVNIAWEIHGTGPIKIMLLSGLASVKSMWQRQVKHFGHDNGTQYSVLIFDNRGMGQSDKPLMRYTTTEMALDTLDLVDHVGWTAPRQLHLVGLSLGGFIMQELACRAPERVASMTLSSTAAYVESTKPWTESLYGGLAMLVPKSTEQSIADTARQLFPKEWLEAPDAERLPVVGQTPDCAEADGGGEYRLFDCNFQRFQAQELNKRRDPEVFTTKGFMCQLVAAGGHKKSEDQLRDMADKVGRERITVVHGIDDQMFDVRMGKKLIEWIQPAVGELVEGMGHAPIFERFEWFNNLMEKRVLACEKLDKVQTAETMSG